jgi:Protein of unknown function (DUF2975)
MSIETEARLQKIKRVSSYLRLLCRVLSILVAVVLVGGAIALAVGRGTIAYHGFFFQIAELSTTMRLVLAVLGVITAAVAWKCLRHLYRLFGNYSRGDIFTESSVAEIRHLGITALLWGAVNVAWSAVVFAYAHPRHADLHIASLWLGAVILIIGWFMEMAVELKQENELTI